MSAIAKLSSYKLVTVRNFFLTRITKITKKLPSVPKKTINVNIVGTTSMYRTNEEKSSVTKLYSTPPMVLLTLWRGWCIEYFFWCTVIAVFEPIFSKIGDSAKLRSVNSSRAHASIRDYYFHLWICMPGLSPVLTLMESRLDFSLMIFLCLRRWISRIM